MDDFKIMTICNYSIGNSEGGIVVHTDGIFPAIVCGGAGHGYGFANVAVYDLFEHNVRKLVIYNEEFGT